MEQATLPDAPARSPRPATGVAVFALAWLAVQIAIPLVQLRETQPARWGWQMYARTNTRPHMVGYGAAGDTVRLRAGDYLAAYRYELSDYADRLAAMACEVEPGLVAVDVREHDAPIPTRFPCASQVPVR